MGYSSDPQSVRVDFFKPIGEWYTTESIRWVRYKSEDDHGNYVSIRDAFLISLADSLQRHRVEHGRCIYCGGQEDISAAEHCGSPKAPHRLAGMTAVCLEPYYVNPYPVMAVVPTTGEAR